MTLGSSENLLLKLELVMLPGWNVGFNFEQQAFSGFKLDEMSTEQEAVEK